MIKLVKAFSHCQNFSPEVSVFALEYIYVCKIVYFFQFRLWYSWAIFTRFHTGPSKGYCQFNRIVPRHWTRWPPCPYMVKTLKNLLLQNQESFGVDLWVYSIGVTSSTKFVQRLNFDLFTARSNLRPIHLFRENVEKSFSTDIWKPNGWNSQRITKLFKLLICNQNFVYCGLSILVPGLYTCMKLCIY